MADCPNCAKHRARTRHLRKLLNRIVLRLTIITGQNILAGSKS